MHFILVHGAWHGPKCWSLLQKSLEEKGHSVECVQFPGSGSSVHDSIDQVTYKNYLAVVKAAIEKSTKPSVLVCHSMSGMVAGPLSDACSDKIVHTFFIAAYIPKQGESMAGQAQKYGHPKALEAFQIEAQKIHLIREKAMPIFYNGLPPSLQEQAFSETHPQVRAPMLEKVDWIPKKDLAYKKTYIACGQDLLIPLRSQLKIAEGIVGHIEILPHTDHFPQLSQTEALTKILLSHPKNPKLVSKL